MKVAIINSEALPIPPVLGGAVEQTLYETALAVHTPQIMVISPWHSALKGHTYPTDTFYHIDTQQEKKRIQDRLGKNWSQANASTSARQQFYYLSGITDLLHTLKPDVIQIHNRPEFVSYFAKQFPQTKRVLYLHNREHFGHGKNLNVQQIDHVVFVSQYLAQCFGNLYPESIPKTTIVQNSVDVDQWHPLLTHHPETRNIQKKYKLCKGQTALFMGRIHPGKGIHFLLEATYRIRQTLPKFKLLIVGKPGEKKETGIDYLNALKRYASHIPDTVEFIDYIEHSKTAHFYATADVVIAPSLFEEGFCKVVAEAMSTGVPVIASQRGALPELIDHGINGFLVDKPENIEQIAQYTVQLLSNRQQQKRMGMDARKKITTYFSTTLRIEKLKTFYAQL